MDRPHYKTRLGANLKAGWVFAILLSTLAPYAARRATGQEVVGHPYINPSEIKSKTCLTCHPGKKEAKFVHAAVELGCEKCHRISSENQTTAITLLASGGELCAKCHEAERLPVFHAPYKSGECLVCHNPHASDFPGQARAPANTLCLSCHGINQPDVKIDSESEMVSLPGGRAIPMDAYEAAPKVDDAHHPSGAPSASSHSSTGQQQQSPENPWDCLSCHEAHGGQARYLLRPAR